jgi:hypothetical protein
MTLSASRTTAGFELVGNLMGVPDNGMEFCLTENTAYSKGDMVVLTNGKVAKAAANATKVLGVMAETFTTTTNPDASETMGKVYTNPYNIYRCSFTGHLDLTATSGSTTTIVNASLNATDNYWIGALVYVYEGTNAGCARIVSDSDSSDGSITVEKAFPAAIDTTSKFILLGEGTSTANLVLCPGANIDIVDCNTLDSNATNASDVGPCTIIKIYPQDLMMDIIIKNHLFNAVA